MLKHQWSRYADSNNNHYLKNMLSAVELFPIHGIPMDVLFKGF